MKCKKLIHIREVEEEDTEAAEEVAEAWIVVEEIWVNVNSAKEVLESVCKAPTTDLPVYCYLYQSNLSKYPARIGPVDQLYLC